jgi:hypothetical protein
MLVMKNLNFRHTLIIRWLGQHEIPGVAGGYIAYAYRLL